MTVLYDQATDTIMDPVVVAMSSAFTPFPSVTIARLGPLPQAQGGVRHRHRRERGRPHPHRPPAHRRVRRGRGERIRRCRPAGGGQERRACAASASMARAELMPAALVDDAAKGPDADPRRHRRPAEPGRRQRDHRSSRARLKGEFVEPAPQLGFSGAAVLDAQGRFFGMAELKAPAAAAPGGTQAQPQAAVVPLRDDPRIPRRPAPCGRHRQRRGRRRQGVGGAGDLRAEVIAAERPSLHQAAPAQSRFWHERTQLAFRQRIQRAKARYVIHLSNSSSSPEDGLRRTNTCPPKL